MLPRSTIRLATAVLVACAAAVSAPLAGAATAPAFPVSVSAANGTVTVPARPVRVVSLSPTATEDLFAIGAGSQVVAVDDQSNYPARAPHSKLSGFTPNVEAIAAYHPDLVVVAYDVKGLVASLTKLHIPVLLQTAPPDLAGAYAEITALGRATGHSAQARTVVRGMRTRIARIVAHTPRPATPVRVYHELSPDFYSATSKTFIGQAYARLGLRDIADAAPDAAGLGYPQLSSEYIVSADPQLIVLTDGASGGQSAATVAARPAWDHVSAVRTGAIVAVNPDISSRWGPRIVGFYKVIAGRVAALVAG